MHPARTVVNQSSLISEVELVTKIEAKIYSFHGYFANDESTNLRYAAWFKRQNGFLYCVFFFFCQQTVAMGVLVFAGIF
jgi:hypothetical protein